MDKTRANASLFISFEGIEGSGKSTQIQLLKEFLESLGKNVISLREPGGTKFGEDLRSAILNSDVSLHPLAEAHLFAASRAQLLKEKILPHLEKENSVVLLDRYIDSSFAYQGIARGLGIDTIEEIHQHPPLNIYPDLTFYLAIEPKESFERQAKRGNEKDYFEKEKESFYQNLIKGFEECLEKFPNRIKKIDATQSINEIHDTIITKVRS